MDPIVPLGLGTTSAVAGFLPTLACLFSAFNVQEGRRSYEGYQVLRVNATNPFGYDIMKRLFLRDNFDFWSSPSMMRPTDVMVCPEQVYNAKLLLNALQIPYEVMITNLEQWHLTYDWVHFHFDKFILYRTIAEERQQMIARQSTTSGLNWDGYHRLDTINKWLSEMEATHDFVSVLKIGESSEGRPLNVLRISKGQAQTKPAIWLDGGIHAREWISPAVVTFIMRELIESTGRENGGSSLVDIFDWYVMPNVNPDGYEYSHTTERLWRKTRSSTEGFFAQFFRCKGVDANRNFEYKWGGKGTSNNPCVETYRGSRPASEPEIASIQKFILQQQQKQPFKLFLTMHSYSQMLFLPWGYDNVRTDDYTELMEVATKAAKALESVYGTRFNVGPSPELLYAAAGGSEDFAKGLANIKYAYCFELRDTGSHGFILPANQIVPSGVETFAAVRSMAEDMARIYNLNTQSQPSPSQLIPKKSSDNNVKY